jgi:tRNA pseudouridine13 synthase
VKFKESPEDFEVEEIPAYAPCGEGEHLFLWIEKRGVSTPDAARRVTRQLGLSERDISWAGLKDKQAVTRQFLCVPAKVGSVLFEDPEVKVLSATRHRNKLKTGHLQGNKFMLRVTDVPADLPARFERLVREGLPNFFGEQRFGASGGNAAEGKKVLLGKKVPRFERKLLLSAYQSSLFNRALERRLAAGTFARALAGDVLKKHETGGEFVCADPAVDQPRMDAFEVSATGPIFGPKMRRAEGEVGAAELRILEEEELQLDAFDAGGGETLGTRRFYRVRLGEPACAVEGDAARLSFSLPAGSYATVVLDQLG